MLKNIKTTPFILIILAAFFLSVATAQSASVKERMAARIPTINALKDKGELGETSKGYLAYRGATQTKKDIIDAENKDRSRVYKAIAKKQGAAAAHVGQRRGKMIFDNGKTGHWFQKSNGSWIRK